MTVPPEERRALTTRYVEVVHRFGQLAIGGVPLRQQLISEGIDFWAASPLRESSPWGSPVFARLDRLRNSGTETHETVTIFHSSFRTKLRSALYWCVNAVLSVNNRVEQVRGDVVFVVFFPESSGQQSDHDIAARYYGGLIAHVKSMGLTPVLLFLPTDSRPAAMTRGEKKTWSSLAKTLPSVTVTSFITPQVVIRALRTWWALRREAPAVSAVAHAVVNNARDDAELAAVWPLLATDYVSSFSGTASVRSSLLAEGFRHALRSVQGAKVVVYPFEGQGWESLLESTCRAQNLETVGYLHTIMKPWDMRAHTALRENPPHTLALHGDYDRSELELRDQVTASVEALRYAYLASPPKAKPVVHDHLQLLIVMGSDCANSQRHFALLEQELVHQAKPWSRVVKAHPQCAFDALRDTGVEVITGSLQDALAHSNAVFLCGTAAPLDSYLFGLPTAALLDAGGYSMNPLVPNDAYFVGGNPAAVVEWLHAAMQRASARPDASHFFDLTPGFTKWEAVLRNTLRATA